MGIENLGAPKGLFGAFSRQALRNSLSGGKDFWNNFDKEIRTPPPPFFPRGSSSVMSDDVIMDSPTTSSSTPSTSIFATTGLPNNESQKEASNGLSRSSTPQPPGPPSAAEGIRKANKRRRDDDLDGMSMKRRAVSPGVSVQNSPILSQSPGQRGDLWGQPGAKLSRETSGGHAAGERANSSGSVGAVMPTIGPLGKRIGMQGMTDTNDGLMKMSIE